MNVPILHFSLAKLETSQLPSDSEIICPGVLNSQIIPALQETLLPPSILQSLHFLHFLCLKDAMLQHCCSP